MVNRRSEIDGEKVAYEFSTSGPLALSPPPAWLPLSLFLSVIYFLKSLIFWS